MIVRSPRGRLFSRAPCIAVVLGGLWGACTITRPADPDLRGRDVRLTLFHTSDIHSRIFPYNTVVTRFDRLLGLDPAQCGCNLNLENGSGRTVLCDDNGKTTNVSDRAVRTVKECNVGGIARIATILERERALSGRHLYLDSGDVFQGGPVFNVFSGEAEIRAFSYLRIDGMVFGNHEIDRGAMNLYLQLKRYGSFPFLAANYSFDDFNDPTRPKLGEFVKPYQIYELDGLRVGVIGMGNQSSLNSIVEGGNSLGIRPLDPNWVVKNYLPILRPQVDVLILLSHMGLEEDEGVAADEIKDSEAEELENISDGVDVILGGHLHIVLNPPKLLPRASGRPTIIAHSGAFAKYVGRLDLVIHKKGPDDPENSPSSYVKGFNFKVIPVDQQVPSDVKLMAMLEPYELELNRRIDLTRKFAYIPGREVRRTNDETGGDSQLGNLVASAMRFRERVDADFAVTNSLGIRANFNSGPLDLEQMFNVFPFENSITVMYLSGAETKEMLDFISARSAERGCLTQSQVSGIWFDMVCRAPAHAENVWIGDHCAPCREPGSPGYQPGECTCRALDPYASYRVAVNDYIAGGGSGFTVLKRNTTKQNTGIPLRDALVDYIQRKIPLCPAECVFDGQSFAAFSCVVPPDVTCASGDDSNILSWPEAPDTRINPIR